MIYLHPPPECDVLASVPVSAASSEAELSEAQGDNGFTVLSTGGEMEGEAEPEAEAEVAGNLVPAVEPEEIEAELREIEGEREIEVSDEAKGDESVSVYVRQMLLDWEYAERKIPFGLLLLFGGGFALASGIEVSGLSAFLGDKLTALAGVNRFLLALSL
ncbi:sodium/sulphate symporter, partial [Kipferlia bialata]|eukprot:g13731.t1